MMNGFVDSVGVMIGVSLFWVAIVAGSWFFQRSAIVSALKKFDDMKQRVEESDTDS